MNAQHTKPSDQQHRVQVQSSIIYAQWMCDKAWASTDAPFEVRTALVGEGAEIKVRLVNNDNKVLEKKNDTIFGNRYRGTIPIPSKVKLGDLLHLEVELPKQKLDSESGEVPAGPVIQVRKLEWDRKEAHRSDTVTMKAEFIDLPDKTQAEVTIYEYDADGRHDPIAAIPVLIKNNRLELKWDFKPRDPGTILTQEELKPYGKNYCAPEYFFTIDIDGTKIGVKQESGLMRFVDKVDFVLKDSDGKPIPDTECIITGPDGKEVKAKSDKDGKVLVKDFPPGPMQILPKRTEEKK
jgi:hypothetical protein